MIIITLKTIFNNFKRRFIHGLIRPIRLIFVGGSNSYLTLPVLTTAQRNALTPTNGMLVYDSDLNLFYKYENGAWGPFAGEEFETTYGELYYNGGNCNAPDYIEISNVGCEGNYDVIAHVNISTGLTKLTTLDNTNGTITLNTGEPANGGRQYRISATASIKDSSLEDAQDYYMAVFVNGVRQTNMTTRVKGATANLTKDMTVNGLVTLNDTDIIDVRITSESGTILQVFYYNFNIERIN